MADDIISVEIRASVEGLTSGLKDASGAVASSAEAMKQSLSGFGGAANDATDHAESFSESLRELKSEATQTGRTANYFATQLTEIIPGAEGAGGALKKMFAIGLEGASLGSGLELAVLVLGTLKEKIQEHEREMVELRRLHFDTWTAIAEALRNVAREFETPLTRVQATMRGLMDGMQKQVAELKHQLGELITKDTQSTWSQALQVASGGLLGLDPAIKSTKEKIEQLTEAMKKLSEGTSASISAAADEYVRNTAVGYERIRSLAVANSDDIVRIQVETNNRLAEMQRTIPDSDPSKAGQLAMVKAEAEERVNELRRERLVEHAKAGVAIEMESANAYERIALESALRIDAIKEKFRLRRGAVSAEQLADELAGEAKRFQRLADLEQEAIEKHRAATLQADRALQGARADEYIKAEKSLTALELQLNEQKYSEQFAAGSAAIRQRMIEETKIVQEALLKQVISAQQADADIAKINKKASDDRIKLYADEQKHFINDFVHPIDAAFRSTITSMINGTKTFSEAMKGFVASMVDALIAGLLKVLAEKVTAAIAGALAAKASNTSETSGNIAVAATGAAASMAGIPYVGPALAAAAAASMVTGLEALSAPLLSARGGLSVPTGVNPIVQIHEEETVLPKEEANVIRDLADGGGAGGVHVHLHAAYIDAASLRNFIASPQFRDGMREAQRNGRL